MKLLLRLFKIIFLFTLVLFLLRGWLFRKTVTYRTIGERKEFPLTDSGFLQSIKSQPIDTNLEKIIYQSLRLTSDRLHFRAGQNETDPNRTFHTRTAHCVGYAAFFATACNALIKQAGMGGRYHASHLRGKVFFLGIDLHRFLKSPFFKDHDFNVIEDRLTGKRFYVDASVRDYLGILYVKEGSVNSE